MVKCPRGTASQVRGNLAYGQRPSVFSFDESFFSWVYDPAAGQMVYVGERDDQTLAGESVDQELDSSRALKRCSPSPRDDLVHFFLNFFLDLLLQSWEGKLCLKPKLGELIRFDQNESEEFGEMDFGPCDSVVSSTVDSLKDLFQKRSLTLSREKSANDALQRTRPRKRDSSTDSECLQGEDFESVASSDHVGAFPPDENVHFVFLNGVWYKGRVSGRLMDGEGIYFWEDGSTFQGEFVGGCVTGKGRLEFSDLSVYEGDVYRGFRHGEGLHCYSNAPVMYCGQWWLGKKHGHGLMVYEDPSKEINFYRGQWQDGAQEGFGFRRYPSGARYFGFWSNGKRHGKGVMLWSNGDIYRGQWKEGLMHGYGEYTWNGFVNRSLSYPATNTFRGSWSEGKRCGQGVLEIKSGATIETVWEDNAKEGPGAVVCCNGTLVVARSLFSKDKQSVFEDKEDNIGWHLRDRMSKKSDKKKLKNEDHLLSYVLSMERAKAISIPINSPVHSLTLVPHTEKYLEQLKKKFLEKLPEEDSEFQMIRPIAQRKNAEPETEDVCHEDSSRLTRCMMEEEKHLRNFVIAKIPALKACYEHYATLACEKPPPSKCFLLRLFLWQLLIDGGVPSSDLSLVDIDDSLAREQYLLLENSHDPFERIRFWQFIHILIFLSWHFYGRHILEERPLVENEKVTGFLRHLQASESKSVLKATFEYFLENNVFRGRFQGCRDSRGDEEKKFEESDLAPMEAMYSIYRKVGEAHSARDLVNAICSKNRQSQEPPIVRYFEKLPFFKTQGKNAMTVAGELNHLPGPEPFNFPQLFEMERKDPNSELTCFHGLRARGVIKCLARVCPGIASEDLVVNMEYKLTFLEFYKVVIGCAELTLKKQIMEQKRDSVVREYQSQVEEYERLVEEYEKLRESTVLSRKKSRQFSDQQRKGRK